MGSRKMWFSPIGLARLTYISPCPIGVLGVELSRKFYGFFVLFFPKLSHRRLGIQVHLGVGTLPIVNKSCGDVTPWSP